MAKQKITPQSRLRELLAERAWTPYRLATDSGVSKQTLGRFLAGGGLRLETVQQVCKALGVSLSVFDDVEFSHENDQ